MNQETDHPQHVSQFLGQLKQNKASEGLLNTHPDIARLLNNKKNSGAYGKVAEYKLLLEHCKFKLAVYWTFDKFGRPYTLQEKMCKPPKNRRHIPSVDRVRRITNEEEGFDVLVNKCLNEVSLMDSAQIYLIDRVQGFEHMVFKFDTKNVMRSQYTQMDFKTNDYGHRYFVDFIDKPIRTDKIISYR